MKHPLWSLIQSHRAGEKFCKRTRGHRSKQSTVSLFKSKLRMPRPSESKTLHGESATFMLYALTVVRACNAYFDDIMVLA